MSLWFNRKKIVRSKKFLEEMNKVIPYDKFEWIIKEKYEKNNIRWRRQYWLKLMLKIHLLQQFYTLWDESSWRCNIWQVKFLRIFVNRYII